MHNSQMQNAMSGVSFPCLLLLSCRPSRTGSITGSIALTKRFLPLPVCYAVHRAEHRVLICMQFIWANYLRPRVPMVLLTVPDVESYVHHGIGHAQLPEASGLPGYSALTPAVPITSHPLDVPAVLSKEQE
jgi:hypothetical protein